jgi:GT2 family glycosyltransferase
MTDIDYVILDLDGGDMLERCIESVRRQRHRWRILVIDNGSQIPTTGRLSVAGVEVTRSERNLGFTGGANLGLALSSAAYVALVNNDAILDDGWSERLVEHLEADSKCAAAQPVVRGGDGTIDGAGIGFVEGRIVQIGHLRPVTDLATLPAAWGVSAVATLYRRAALDAVRVGAGEWFDDRFFAYYEDAELSARLLAAGWTIAVLPMTMATHEGSVSAERIGPLSAYLRTRNRYLLKRLHPQLGSTAALVSEDTRRLARALLSGRAGAAWNIVRGMAAGLSMNLETRKS